MIAREAGAVREIHLDRVPTDPQATNLEHLLTLDRQAEDGRRVQVKCRVVRPRQTGNYSFLRSWEFDVCVFVQLDSPS